MTYHRIRQTTRDERRAIYLAERAAGRSQQIAAHTVGVSVRTATRYGASA